MPKNALFFVKNCKNTRVLRAPPSDPFSFILNCYYKLSLLALPVLHSIVRLLWRDLRCCWLGGFESFRRLCQWHSQDFLLGGGGWRGLEAEPPVTIEHRESGGEVTNIRRQGGLETERFLQFFNKNNAFLCIFGKNSYFKALHFFYKNQLILSW